MLTLTDDKLLKFVLIWGKSCVVFVWGEKLGCPRTLFIILLKSLFVVVCQFACPAWCIFIGTLVSIVAHILLWEAMNKQVLAMFRNFRTFYKIRKLLL